MTAAPLTLTIEQRSHYYRAMHYYHPGPLVNGVPSGAAYDFTGFTAKLQIRSKPTSDEVLLDASTENGMIALGSAGLIELSFPDEATTELTKNAVYDFLLIDADGEPTRIFGGPVVVTLGVTRLA